VVYTFRQIRMPSLGWRGLIGLTLAIAAGLALIVLSLGLAIVLIPVVALAVLIGRWRMNKILREQPQQPNDGRKPAQIIEAEYTVIEDRNGR
jgi:membrane protein implicated in regulation of membrane protease activity